MKIVEEECDEALYWMDLLIESGQVKVTRLDDLISEANEILSLVVASLKTARSRTQTPDPQSSIVNRQSSIGSGIVHVARR